MRFGLQRSLIFWSGLLAVVFLMWAARDSREYRSYLRVGPLELASAGGGVVLKADRDAAPGFAAGRQPALVVRRALEGPFLLQGKGEIPPHDWSVEDWWDYQDLCSYVMSFQTLGSWMLFMPYWLLLMAAGVMWWVLLVWRQQRRMDWGQEK